ncbi:MAG: hypothetical protein GTO45_02990 [Candidatus Aminicenantes bacterium]|nr:hypothetical protein [Candidatus Aminicenantes bacterium]NIM77692.1 hypothetical protein [Candidatus Aminicenantes bacterium]NIN17005.1 hypothetical protein [Candidatus Aminicenantes bacterium]NIN40898.1 hypothetical protein [Candidatus Aminicenantes bacterium]NIN83703.1 hypothetical protein [Candidatus Aminicenantes bacterium]
MKKITLILGGIRSGKSHFAEQKAEFYSEKPVYIATAIAFDEEMKLRIAMHRQRRGVRYETVEAPYDITGPLDRLKDRTVLVDCLTLNLSNRLLANEEHMELEELIESDEAYLEDIHEIITKNNLNVIFVSNEVGFAPIEINKLGRYFQDLQGRWNRIMAWYADEVYMVQAGIPTLIKKKNLFPFRVSAPSYLLPTGAIENVTYLMDKVDDIQLLAFDSTAQDPLFKKDTLMTLEYLAKESGVTYSVHMPVKPKLFDHFEKRLDAACFIIEKLSCLRISTFSVHYDLPDGKKWQGLKQEEKRGIEDTYIKFFNALKGKFPGIDISLENTETPLSALDRVVSGCGISYCIEIGHLLVQGWDLAEIESRLEQASVVHLHGWEEREGKRQDHRPITYDRKIFKLLESYRGILTIENYHKLLFEKSLEVLGEYF